MVIGGCGGGALGIVLHSMGLIPHPATFVIVGMAGFFAAAAKTPFSTLVMVSELTGNYNLLLPALWVCVLAFLLSDEQSIYRSQVETRSRSPAHQGSYVREVLEGLQVGQFLTTPQEVPTLRPGDRIADVVKRLGGSALQALPVVNEEGKLLGVVSLEEAHLASISPHLRGLVVATDMMRSDVTPLHSEDRLDRALELFVESDLLALPVVDGDMRVIGVVKRADISGAYLRQVHGEHAQDNQPPPTA
jgi:CIC family chloride channel protein